MGQKAYAVFVTALLLLVGGVGVFMMTHQHSDDGGDSGNVVPTGTWYLGYSEKYFPEEYGEKRISVNRDPTPHTFKINTIEKYGFFGTYVSPSGTTYDVGGTSIDNHFQFKIHVKGADFYADCYIIGDTVEMFSTMIYNNGTIRSVGFDIYYSDLSVIPSMPRFYEHDIEYALNGSIRYDSDKDVNSPGMELTTVSFENRMVILAATDSEGVPVGNLIMSLLPNEILPDHTFIVNGVVSNHYVYGNMQFGVDHANLYLECDHEGTPYFLNMEYLINRNYDSGHAAYILEGRFTGELWAIIDGKAEMVDTVEANFKYIGFPISYGTIKYTGTVREMYISSMYDSLTIVSITGGSKEHGFGLALDQHAILSASYYYNGEMVPAYITLVGV